MFEATRLDLYQLTSLIVHWDQHKSHTSAWMSFFSRALPKNYLNQTSRHYIVFSGLKRALDWLKSMRFDEAHLQTLLKHPTLGPALQSRPALVEELRNWRFRGEVWAPKEGSLIWANPALDIDGQSWEKNGVQPAVQTPYFQIKADLFTLKLIETPLLSIINHQCMVASKASNLVELSNDKPIFEFGTRRTNIDAAVDAAYAAYLGGCAGTSNVEAHHRYGVPVVGTMDHFAIQAWEEVGVSRAETEKAFFKAFYAVYPSSASLLVDTYDTFGEHTGIRNAVTATDGKLSGIRIDSRVNVDTLIKARKLLDELNAPQAKILVSGGLDESNLAELSQAPVDAFGIGEKLVTSEDSPIGVGAVGKLSKVGDRMTMKLSRGSAKATLPGPVQVFRQDGVDVVALSDEIWDGEKMLHLYLDIENGIDLSDSVSLATSRAYCAEQRKLYKGKKQSVRLSPKLLEIVSTLANQDD
jgi:nicotinate phosphoribosyltransferase